ncbi:MAG: hypothetical protein J6T36_00650 [Campylobacter sp.]|nr:hypothetical protein [Campylobacter sp.]
MTKIIQCKFDKFMPTIFRVFEQNERRIRLCAYPSEVLRRITEKLG